MKCDECSSALRKRECRYAGDGQVLTTYEAPAGKVYCREFGREEPYDFGCVRFRQAEDASEQTEVTLKEGEPWQHWEMIPCPGCQGGATGNSRCQCVGTGHVRKYDDGFVGEERTRRHPKEIELIRAGVIPKPVPLGGTVLAPKKRADAWQPVGITFESQPDHPELANRNERARTERDEEAARGAAIGTGGQGGPV